jgi:tetratricopeptide (TPR) repeat protein
VRCPHCQQENPSVARFCLACGMPLRITCTRCGTELPAHARFCIECGSPAVPPDAQPAEALAPSDWSPAGERSTVSAAPSRVVLARADVLHALYAQGRDALRRGDGAAAAAALAPVIDEAPNAYPDAHRLLAEAQGRRADRAATTRAAWRRAPRAVGPAARDGAERTAAVLAATWRARGRPLVEAVQGLPGGRRARAGAGTWLRPARGAMAGRGAFPVWALVIAVVVLVGGLLVQRAGSAGPRAADAQQVPPVPALESEADLAARCQAAVGAASWDEAILACRVLRARAPDRDGLADDLAAAYLGRGQARVAAGDDLAGAAADFQQALSYQPESTEAQSALKLLSLYQEGDKALTVGDWPTAVAQFSAAYADEPDYMQTRGARSLRGRLFAAWLAWGQSALNAGAAPDAAQRCGQALALVPDDPDAQRCLAATRGPEEEGEPPGEGAPTDLLRPAPRPWEA